jgi:hypothetical protein
LFLDSVKRFEARSAVLMRVRPDDEALVAEMLAAAKERVSGLDAWSVQGDPDIAPGGLVLESANSRVESRVEERRSVVDETLRHILLPAAPEEESGRADLAQVAAGAAARMFDLVPRQPRGPAAPYDAAAADAAEETYAEEQTPVSQLPASSAQETTDFAVPDGDDAVDAVLAEGGFLPADEET